MSSLRKPPPDLVSLPNEILAQICANAADSEPSDTVDGELRGLPDGKHWLQAVRLTCRRLYDPATVEFAKRFLTRPCVMLSRYSLQQLIDLCKHPLVGPYVQEVCFCPYRMSRAFLDQLNQQLYRLMHDDRLNSLNMVKTYLVWYVDKLEDELRLEKQKQTKRLLEEAFKALRVCDTPVTLSAILTPSQAYTGAPLGLGAFSQGRLNDEEFQSCSPFHSIPKEIVILEVVLIGSWDDVLLWIKHNLRLEKFVLSNTYTYDRRNFQTRGQEWRKVWLDGGVEFAEHDKVTLGLADVLDKKRRQRLDPGYSPDWPDAVSFDDSAYDED
ncbi:hypothetical protein KCU65_g3296, partial [Aureobasidium melanogenum]